MLIAMNAGIYKKGATASSFSGLLGANGAVSTILGTTRTYTLGAGNSGQVRFQSVSVGGTFFLYSLDGDAFTDITEGLVITLANTNTLQLRSSGMTTIGTTNSCDVIDVDTGTALENVTMVRV